MSANRIGPMQVGRVTCEASSTIQTSKRLREKIGLKSEGSQLPQIEERKKAGGNSLVDGKTGCSYNLRHHQLIIKLAS